jgi:multidrug resistance efflux pump
MLRLPDVERHPEPGDGFIRKAARATLWVFAVLGALAIMGSVLLRVDLTVDADGVLEPGDVWPVRARTTGSILEVRVKTSDTVNTGQVLATLDATELVDATEALRARRDVRVADTIRTHIAGEMERVQVLARVEQATAQTMRSKAVLRQRLVEFGLADKIDSVLASVGSGANVIADAAAADVLAAETSLRTAKAQLALPTLTQLALPSQRAELRQLDAELQATLRRQARFALVAPAAGVVLTDRLDRLRGVSVREGDVVMEVGNLTGWRTVLSVQERDVVRVHRDDVVRLELPALAALGESRIAGRVTSVAPGDLIPFPAAARNAQGVSSITSLVGAYQVIVEVDARELAALGLDNLRRGYTVRARIVTKSRRGIAVVWDRLRSRP